MTRAMMRAGLALGIGLGCAGTGLGGEPAPAQGAPKWEPVAFASDIDFLDGPSQEALGSGRSGLPATDSEGNVYLVNKCTTSRIRCLRADGRTETIVGDDRWPGNFGLAEGPAASFPHRGYGPRAGEYCVPGALLTVCGLPLKGGEHGRIYIHGPGDPPYKIFKNKEKGERWWFKRLGAPGKPKPPATVGQTVKLDDFDLTGARIRPGIVAWQGNVYTFDEPKGEMTCSFTLAEYEPKVLEFLGRAGKPVGPPEHYACTDDGSVYLLYMWGTYPAGHIFRMSPDRKKFEHIVADVTWNQKFKGADSNYDGPGLKTTWHCGPSHISSFGNVLFLDSIDSAMIRRCVGGRVSKLCPDGEWRELPGGRGGIGLTWSLFFAGQERGANYIYVPSPSTSYRFWRFGPVDIAKPTVGPPQELKEPEAVKKEGGQK